MPRRIPLIILAVFLLSAWQKPGSLPEAGEIESTLRELSLITGFQVRHQLPFQMVTRDDVNKFLNDKIKKSAKPGEIRAEEITLKKFGFVPADFDLKKNTIDLLTEQAAAFYDYDKKKLFISDWAAKNMRDAALVHELAHALADQNYSIAKYLKGGGKSSEESAAREAVVEGQASWLMLEVAARRAGTSLGDPATAKQYLKGEPDGSDGDFPVFDKSPLYLQKTLLFPYDAGLKFQQAVFKKDGATAFARLFQQAPMSTAQILHPEQYEAKIPFSMPVLPKPEKGWKGFTTGSLGELETAVLLEQYVNKATASWLSTKLKGSTYRIDERKSDHKTMLVYISEWADADSAKAYFERYRQVLEKKWQRTEITSTAASRFSGKSEDGYFDVTLNGSLVTSREGLAEPN